MTAEYQLKSFKTVSTFSSDIPQCHIQILLSTDKSIQCHSLLKMYEIALNIPKPIGTFLLPIAAQRYQITHNLHHEMADTLPLYPPDLIKLPTVGTNRNTRICSKLLARKIYKNLCPRFPWHSQNNKKIQSSCYLVFKREFKRHDSSGWPKYKHNKSNEHGHNSVSPTHKISHSITFIMNGGD